MLSSELELDSLLPPCILSQHVRHSVVRQLWLLTLSLGRLSQAGQLPWTDSLHLLLQEGIETCRALQGLAQQWQHCRARTCRQKRGLRVQAWHCRGGHLCCSQRLWSEHGACNDAAVLGLPSVTGLQRHRQCGLLRTYCLQGAGADMCFQACLITTTVTVQQVQLGGSARLMV